MPCTCFPFFFFKSYLCSHATCVTLSVSYFPHLSCSFPYLKYLYFCNPFSVMFLLTSKTPSSLDFSWVHSVQHNIVMDFPLSVCVTSTSTVGQLKLSISSGQLFRSGYVFLCVGDLRLIMSIVEADNAVALRISFFCSPFRAGGCSTWVVKCLPIFMCIRMCMCG